MKKSLGNITDGRTDGRITSSLRTKRGHISAGDGVYILGKQEQLKDDYLKSHDENNGADRNLGDSMKGNIYI